MYDADFDTSATLYVLSCLKALEGNLDSLGVSRLDPLKLGGNAVVMRPAFNNAGEGSGCR